MAEIQLSGITFEEEIVSALDIQIVLSAVVFEQLASSTPPPVVLAGLTLEEKIIGTKGLLGNIYF